MQEPRKLQVFVSSTYSDLVDERGTAVSAILKAGHIPAGMELFSAGDKSQLDVIKAWIDESDVYMLILGTRYGSIEPVSQLSYTETEYDYAVATNKPLFALVMSENFIDAKLRATGGAFVESDNPEKLKAFKAKVLSRICSICDDTRDIKGSVYESMIDFSRRADLTGWVRGNMVIDPKPLQARIMDLVTENERLKSDLSDARTISAEITPDLNDEKKFEELRELLISMKRIIPINITQKDDPIERNVYGLFSTNRSLLVTGVRIRSSSVAKSRWFESNVWIPLATHKILQIDRKATGERLYHMTELGLDFSSWIDRRNAKADQA